jgi:hypothetical protein
MLGLWACGDHDHGNPTVKFLEPTNGSTVTGPDITVRVEIGEAEPSASPAAKVAAAEAIRVHGEHVHLYLDKPATTDAAATAVLEEGETSTVLAGVAPGSHYLIAQGGDENHRPIAGMRDSVAFMVSP